MSKEKKILIITMEELTYRDIYWIKYNEGEKLMAARKWVRGKLYSNRFDLDKPIKTSKDISGSTYFEQ